MSATVRRPPSPQTHCTAEQYAEWHRRALADPDGFWLEQAARLDWTTPPRRAGEWSFDPVDIRWFADGRLNLCHNAVDRHVGAGHGARTALIFEPDNPEGERRTLTYADLQRAVIRMANALKALGVRRGDRVTLYLPMAVEGITAMLACARLGAVHSVVFGGFSAEALAGRIRDCGSRFVVTADGGRRGGRAVPLKSVVDEALQGDGLKVDGVLVVAHSGETVAMVPGRDHWLHDLQTEDACPCEEMSAEDPLFILYTSGSTGKPKGVVHTTGGYGVWTATTFRYVFDFRPGEVFWCTADIGWITGHSYVAYGPLLNGATQVIFEGVPNWPDPGRIWDVVDRHRVAVLYTAPTAIRALMREGDAHVTRRDRSSLRLLGTVGEPINPEAWRWYHEVVGEGRCPIVDTWWQTETGGVMITTLPGAHDMKPGAAGLPFFGVQPELLDAEGRVLEGEASGNLCLAASWPGQARTVHGDHQRFVDTYFSAYPGRYFTGDGCRRDADGYHWITGRVDDVLNVSGHRLGTAEIESALVLHDAVAEAAVVGVAHPVKGQGIYCYVSPLVGVTPSDGLRAELKALVRREIGAVATPDVIHFTDALPKTRSGKIMRRILRKIADGQVDDLGDVSTLADPALVERLVAGRADD
ncbi:acetate--CoA ligase [Erythrobacteraceae bacterium CFH 75059]|uniref:acetate--CoA ligase n=1 Tax=Qipengyuania thermophila TaxID=2509361 RepID=UPI0010217B48|nr:acetate--CoA ligase [Qipengyuania thermophila]TCD02063.1 acetate--CoA ligase [Erythrobacteraceae bacterium CFH 75059]